MKKTPNKTASSRVAWPLSLPDLKGGACRGREVIALLAWRFGLTSDLEFLIANTPIYGLRDAISNHQPGVAGYFARLSEVHYVAHVDEDGEREKLWNWFNSESAQDLGFMVVRSDPSTGIHVRIPDSNRDRFLATFRAVFGAGRATIRIDFDSL